MFSARASTFVGQITADASVGAVFPLFSPQGERLWVPGWDPEILHPAGNDWREGQVFRTREEMGEAIWVITRLDQAQHRVEYHRVEPGRYVAHIAVGCKELPGRRTQVSTAYSFVGLSEVGNQDIAAMTQEAYDAKMSRWSTWVNQHLASPGRRPG
jgi:hypothetical protein